MVNCLVFIYFINSGSTDPNTSYNNYCSEWAYEGGAKYKFCFVKLCQKREHDKVVLPLEAVGSSFGSCHEGSIPSTTTADRALQKNMNFSVGGQQLSRL